MISHLNVHQRSMRKAFRTFADEWVTPRADEFDAGQFISRKFVRRLGADGYLGATLATKDGGARLDMVTYGLLTEELGRACSTTRNFVACQDMVAVAIARFANAEQKGRWLPKLVSGEVIGAFCLTEPDIGSDAQNVTTSASDHGDGIVLDGVKKWISFGQIAELLLVFAQYDGRLSAFLVETDAPGVEIRPMKGMMGLRGSMLAEISFSGCRLDRSALVSRPGTGLTFVASTALDLGRYSTAWGSVGLAQASLDASLRYAAQRVQYSVPLRDHQLIQRMLADMTTSIAAARLLCHQAGTAKLERDPDAVRQTFMAKYFASCVAMRAASDAVQIHGAQGVGPELPIQRFYRDAKIMELIEGTTQIHQTILGRWSAAPADGETQ